MENLGDNFLAVRFFSFKQIASHFTFLKDVWFFLQNFDLNNIF